MGHVYRLFAIPTIIVLVLALFFSVASAESPEKVDDPVPLAACRDIRLMNGLHRTLADLKLDKAVESKKLCVALVDVTDIKDPRFADANGDHMMYAASLPKIAILLGAFERIERGDMELDRETKQLLTSMIRKSSNSAATTLLHRVGGEFILDLLKSDKYHFYDEQQGGGLWVGKEYGKGKAYKRDPLYNISHGATAMQTARFLYLLETGNLVSLKSCRLMKGMMSKPGIHHKFVAGLLDKDPDARVFRKSGTWRTYHADAAIVERDDMKYIAVGLANSPSGGTWLKSFIQGVDDLIQSRHKNTHASAE